MIQRFIFKKNRCIVLDKTDKTKNTKKKLFRKRVKVLSETIRALKKLTDFNVFAEIRVLNLIIETNFLTKLRKFYLKTFRLPFVDILIFKYSTTIIVSNRVFNDFFIFYFRCDFF